MAKKKGSKGSVKSSAPSNHAVGSGSRPGGGKIKIGNSAPADAHGLGRKTKNTLK